MKSTKKAIIHTDALENELDIGNLFRALWSGKGWILGVTALFMTCAFLYSLFAEPKWSTKAVTDEPAINMLGNYYKAQQFLQSIQPSITQQVQDPSPVTVNDRAYAEFIAQLGSYDARRAFWLQSTYYKQRVSGDPQQQAILLDKLIHQIQFTPRNNKDQLNDTITLTAVSAVEAAQLLGQYIDFVNQRTVEYLGHELQGAWQAKLNALQVNMQQLKDIAQLDHQQRLQQLTRALQLATQLQIVEPKIPQGSEVVPQGEQFLWGESVLKARLTALQEQGPVFDTKYIHDQALSKQLQTGFHLDNVFKTYRYLRTPEKPVTRDSPRVWFLLLMWGGIGSLIGAGIALSRRVKNVPQDERVSS